MHKTMFAFVAAAAAASSTVAFAQSDKPRAATYITKEEIDTVNSTPGTDRNIRVVDIGTEHLAIGVIHRGPSASPDRPRGGGLQRLANEPPCGVAEANPAPTDAANGLTHEKQTEGYYIISGGGVLVTGGHLVNGRQDSPDSPLVTTLNGPTCHGAIGGPDVVKRQVKAGDVIIIPPGVPHGWAEVPDHVDYLSFRPSGDLFTAGYVNPALKK
ncbi:MAG TPA: hypothetical protein VMU59_12680 [Caulobacteraceae bacterium]|nr:hypothetical protein [Caulobacteraceae bacterium]